MIQMSQHLFMRVCAFIHVMADTCCSCARPKTFCSECDLCLCRDIDAALRELSSMPDELKRKDKGFARHNFSERASIYLNAIRKAGRPVTAREVDSGNALCGRGLKYWTLRRMAKLGMIKTIFVKGKTYFTMTNKETKNANNQHRA